MKPEQKPEAKTAATWRQAAIVAARLAVGAVFVVSGMAKSIDLWGTCYKIEEYFAVWSLDTPYVVTTALAAVLAWGEFLLGALCMLGCYRRVVPWLMALFMCVMLPLTFYIWIDDPVADCGCFGDLLKLSNPATFWKNVALAAALIPLLLWNTLARPFIPRFLQWIAGAVLTLIVAAIGLWGYNVQPLADFRSFPVGTDMNAAGEGAGQEASYVFVYRDADGREKDFSIDSLPEGDGWTFVERRLTGGDERQADRFAVFDSEGEDASAEAFPSEGDALIVAIPDLARVNPSHTFGINELERRLRPLGIPVITILAPDSRGIRYWYDIAMPDYPVFTADPTQIKELVRGTIGLVWLRDGVIQWKRTLSSLPSPDDLPVFAGKDGKT